MSEYDPEVYWSRVAEEIDQRGVNYIAGDDNPYYRYKRRKFLKRFLDTLDFRSKIVLEVGFGPGGNLRHIATNHAPRRLLGADISQKMLEVATKNLAGYNDVTLTKIDGATLPFPDQSVDISYTVTVLQHNTDEVTFTSLVRELCRVTKTSIIIMEDIGENNRAGGEGDWTGRQVDVYTSVFAACGFQLSQLEFLNTKISRWWYDWIFTLYRRVAAPGHREGDPIGVGMKWLIAIPMPLTRVLDRIFVEQRDLARMAFRRA